jgi:hypothetical protein
VINTDGVLGTYNAAFSQFVGDVHENAAQNFTAAPGLKAAMNFG